MNRRQFLQGAAALPLVAALPVVTAPLVALSSQASVYRETMYYDISRAAWVYAVGQSLGGKDFVWVSLVDEKPTLEYIERLLRPAARAAFSRVRV